MRQPLMADMHFLLRARMLRTLYSSIETGTALRATFPIDFVRGALHVSVNLIIKNYPNDIFYEQKTLCSTINGLYIVWTG